MIAYLWTCQWENMGCTIICVLRRPRTLSKSSTRDARLSMARFSRPSAVWIEAQWPRLFVWRARNSARFRNSLSTRWPGWATIIVTSNGMKRIGGKCILRRKAPKTMNSGDDVREPLVALKNHIALFQCIQLSEMNNSGCRQHNLEVVT
jgi:hypothetical protein